VVTKEQTSRDLDRDLLQSIEIKMQSENAPRQEYAPIGAFPRIPQNASD